MALGFFSYGQSGVPSSTLNNNFRNVGMIHQIYSSTGFDVDATGSSVTDTSSLELDAIDSSDITDCDYIGIEINAFKELKSDQDAYAKLFITVESKEIGGAYSDSLAETVILQSIGQSGGEQNILVNYSPFKYYHSLTAGEKSNGVQFRITAKATTGGDTDCYAKLTNKQTIVQSVSGK